MKKSVFFSLCLLQFLSLSLSEHATAFVSQVTHQYDRRVGSASTSQLNGFFEGFFGGKKEAAGPPDDDVDDGDLYSEAAFRDEMVRRREQENAREENGDGDGSEDFSGYDLRDVIYAKWGQYFDVEFRPVQVGRVTMVYLNIMPFTPQSRRFRHESENDYLCHLQAVVDILIKYDRLESVLAQLYDTDKVPRANTSPLIAVPFRLNLPPEVLDKVLRGG